MDGGGFGGGSSLFFWGRRRETEVDEVEMGTVLQTTIQTQKPKHVASSTGWGGGANGAGNTSNSLVVIDVYKPSHEVTDWLP